MNNNELIFKYKAKTIDLYPRIICGYYYKIDDDNNDPFRVSPINEKHIIQYYTPGDWNMGNWSFEEVDPNTLCTKIIGVHTIDGDDIYEYDCLEIYDKESENIGNFYFKWNIKNLCFDLKYSDEYPFEKPTINIDGIIHAKINHSVNYKILGRIPIYPIPKDLDYYTSYLGNINNIDIYCEFISGNIEYCFMCLVKENFCKKVLIDNIKVEDSIDKLSITSDILNFWNEKRLIYNLNY